MADKASRSGDTFSGPVSVDPPGLGVSTVDEAGFHHYPVEPGGGVASLGHKWGIPMLVLGNTTLGTPSPGVLRVVDAQAQQHGNDLVTKSYVDSHTSNIRARDTDPHAFADIGPKGENGKEGIIAALEAAEAAGGCGLVRLRPNQTYLIEGTLDMAGYSSSITGAFPSAEGSIFNASATGTVLRAVNQTGPVIDFSEFIWPRQSFGRIDIGGFAIEGDGSAGRHKSGIRVRGASSAWFHDICITRTGGPCMEVERYYLSEMDRIIMGTPMAAYAEDIPYLVMRATNCSHFSRFGFRSLLPSHDVGAAGAAVIEDDGTNNGHDCTFTAWWFENLHPGSDSTMFHHEGYANMIRDFQFVDCASTQDGPGHSNPRRNSYFRFASCHSGINGGNELTGRIPGGGTAPQSIQYGVEVYQEYNSIRGVKGYHGRNVLLGPDVSRCSVHLAGSLQAASGPAVVMEGGRSIPTTVRVHDDWVG